MTIAPIATKTATIPERMVSVYLAAILAGIGGDPVVLKSRQTRPGRFIVLALRQHWGSPYVTWYIGEYGAVEGHYFTDADEAEQDYKSRSGF